MKRPQAIVWFERFYILGLALGSISLIATWDEIVPAEGDDIAAITTIAVGVFVLFYALSFVFWFLIMYRRSNVARWVLTIVTVLAAPLSFIDPDGRPWDACSIVEIAGTLADLAAVVLLFRRDARSWFDGTPDNLAETFS